MATLVSTEVNTGKKLDITNRSFLFSKWSRNIIRESINDDFGDALIYVVPVPTPGDTNALTRTQTFSNGSEAVWY